MRSASVPQLAERNFLMHVTVVELLSLSSPINRSTVGTDLPCFSGPFEGLLDTLVCLSNDRPCLLLGEAGGRPRAGLIALAIPLDDAGD